MICTIKRARSLQRDIRWNCSTFSLQPKNIEIKWKGFQSFLGAMTLFATTTSIMTLSITIKNATLSKMTISITVKNEALSKILCSVAHLRLLCWVLLCWVLLCQVSLCRVSWHQIFYLTWLSGCMACQRETVCVSNRYPSGPNDAPPYLMYFTNLWFGRRCLTIGKHSSIFRNLIYYSNKVL